MADLVATTPVIDGCDDFWEEMAAAFAVRAAASANDLARRTELTLESTTLNQTIASLRPQQAAAGEDHAAAVEAYNAVAKFPHFALITTLAVLLASILLACLAAELPKALAVPLVLVIVAYLAYIVTFHRKRAAAAVQVRATATRLEQLTTEVNTAADRLQACSLELNSITPKRSVTALGRCYVQADVRRLAGYSVLLDRSGIVPSNEFSLADMTYDSAALSAIVSTIDDLREPPLLLSPSTKSDDGSLGDLHGQERRLRDTVERFSMFVRSIPRVVRSLPLLHRTSGAATQHNSWQPSPHPLYGPIIVRESDVGDDSSIAALQRTIDWSRSRGRSAKDELLAAHGAIQSLLADYTSCRSVSMSQLHNQLLSATRRSRLCSVIHLCPQMTGNSAWLLEAHGISLEELPETPLEDVLQFLDGVPDARERIAAEPSLIRRIEESWLGVTIAHESLSRHLSNADTSLRSIGVATSPAASSSAGIIQKYRDQLSQLREQCRSAFLEAMFGTSVPLVEASLAARLSFDPATRIWSNSITGNEYEEDSLLELCRVTRAHVDLKLPMWTQLWTEKSDFRKSELFRSNESVLRMSEKESEKLIEIGNQFRADMRAVRESAKETLTELGAKSDQLRHMVDHFGDSLPSAELTRLQDLTLRIAGAGTGVLKDAEQKETFLSLEPQAQADRRPRMQDPISHAMRLDQLATPALPNWLDRALCLPAPELAGRADVE